MSRRRVFAILVAGAIALGGLSWWTARAAAEPACRTLRFEGSRFTACTYDPAHHELALITKGADGLPLRSFRALRLFLEERASGVVFAMNAGMYDDRGRPIGLYVEEGDETRGLNTRDGPGNFHLKPNGVFWIDGAGRARVTEAATYASAPRAPRWASQSGPMLVINGALHPAIAPDGASLHLRNGVGACGEHGGAVFVISEERVSFGRLARLFRDELKCSDALYFDGSVSSLWWPNQGRMDARASLGPMAVISVRASED